MRRLLLPVIVLVILAGGCSSQPPVPEDRYYRLPDANPPGKTTLLTEGSIFVERFLADGIYQERAIAYSEGTDSNTVLQHHYSFWLDSPATMLQTQLEDYLRRSDAAPMVSGIAEAPAQISIFGRIRQLDRVLTSGSVEVRVALEFNVKTRTGDEPLLAKEYTAQVKAADQEMSSSVSAFAAAMSKIFGELVADIHSRLDQAGN